MNITDNQEKINVTVSVQEKQGRYYAVLQWKDRNGKKQYQWKATKVKAEKGKKAKEKKAEKEATIKAEEIRRQFEIELNAPKLLSPTTNNSTDMLFGNYMLDWLEKHKHNIEASTNGGYEGNVKRTAIYFNDLGITLQELRTKHIQEYYDQLQTTKNLKWNTVKRYHANIRKALEDAIRLELIDNNPADHIKPGKCEQYIAEHYNAEELNKLFEISKNELIEPIILVTAYYGLRKEETLGLKWDAIDFENKTITIKHVVTNGVVNGKRVVIKKNRTKGMSSYRTLPLMEDIEKLLLKEKAKQEENQKVFGNTYKNTDNYIFVDEEGELIKPDRVNRRFKKLLEDNNLRYIRFHDLRHSCATLLLALGRTLEDIQIWLGHSTIKTTEIYANNIVLDKTTSADTIANALKIST